MKTILKQTFIAAGICALAVAGQAQTPRMMDADTNTTGNMNWETNTMPLTAQSFVWAAATTDMKEIHLGEMALQKSDNADVKRFAKRIVADHKSASKKLQAIAEKEGLHFPDTNSMAWDNNGHWRTNSMNDGAMTNATGQFQHPPVERQSMDSPPHLAYLMVSNANDTMDDHSMAEINWDMLSGTDFDRAFANHMVMGHEKAIQKFEDASANLSDADLKNYAEKTLPTLREHLRLAQELQSKVGMWTDSNMTNSMPRTQ